jgi:ketosteroid isomerase-like protein
MEIKDGILNSFSRSKYDLQLEIIEVKSYGDHGYVILSGKVTLSPKAGGEPVTYKPAAILIFNKIDNEWKISRQVYNFREYPE